MTSHPGRPREYGGSRARRKLEQRCYLADAAVRAQPT